MIEEQEPIIDARLDTATVSQPIAHLEEIDLEEEYRRRVGARLNQTVPAAKVPFLRTSKGLGIGAGAVIAVLAIILFATVRSDAPLPPTNPAAINTRYVAQQQEVVSGQVDIKAGGLVQYPIKIESEMYEATLKGTFEGVDGGEVLAIVAEEADFQNWVDGRATQVLWGTDRPRGSAKFDVTLRPGTYHLVFSNKFSEHYSKTVSVDAVLHFKRLETY